MVIKLYKTLSDRKVVAKVLENEMQFDNVIFHNSKDLINPTFKLATTQNIQDYNYLYCDKFKRYYFISNITFLNTGLYTIECELDIRKSYENDIRNLTCTVKRNENNANAYLFDSNYKSVAYSQIVTKAFPQGIENDSMILLTVG